MKTETQAMTDTAREIILSCLTGALSAHNPNWAVIDDDPIITTILQAIYQVQRMYPAPTDPIARQVFADFFGH